jgi:hypothetical protein
MKNEIFKANPQLDCYFETVDGECFFTDNAAKNHAGSLAEKTLKTHHKSDYVKPTEEVDEVVEPTEPVEETDEPTQKVDEVAAPTEPVQPVEEIEVIAEIVEPTEPLKLVVSVEGKAKNQKK